MKQSELLENYENLDLKKLPKQLRKSGFDYELLLRTNSKCIYKQMKDGRIVTYEVFKNHIVTHRAGMKKFANQTGIEKDFSDCNEYAEKFPGDEEFGKRAWSCATLEAAMKRYEALA